MIHIKKLAVATIALNITVLVLATIAWSQQNTALPTALSISILLAIIAYGLMWVHYVSDWLKRRYWPHQTTGWQYGISRWIVLIAILAHPILINAYLFENNYGLPLESYQKYFGSSVLIFILLGIVSLAAFLAFEVKKWLEHKPVWQWVMHANNLAMLLIVIHGYKLGPITDSRWYFWVWTVQALILCAILFLQYFQHPRTLIQYIGILVIIGAICAVTWMSLLRLTTSDYKKTSTNSNVSDQTNQPINNSKNKAITSEILTKNNGLQGAPCWIAVDRTVYDASNSPQWVNGEHAPSNGRTKCGQDLSVVIQESPHGSSVLESLTYVGVLR